MSSEPTAPAIGNRPVDHLAHAIASELMTPGGGTITRCTRLVLTGKDGGDLGGYSFDGLKSTLVRLLSSQPVLQPASPQGETVPLNLDHQRSRAVHRVVRAMHDGECPKCHALYGSDEMIVSGHAPPGSPGHHRCPRCGFEITAAECAAAMGEFAKFMEQNLAVFEEWRSSLPPVPVVQAVVVQEGGGQ